MSMCSLLFGLICTVLKLKDNSKTQCNVSFPSLQLQTVFVFYFIFDVSSIIPCTLDKINCFPQLGLSTATKTNQISIRVRIHRDLQWAPFHLGLMSVFHSLLVAISYLGDLNNFH